MSTARLLDRAEDLALLEGWLEEYADAIEANGGELPPELAALFDEAMPAFEEKISRTAAVVASLNADADYLDSEIKRLQAKKKAKENRAERLKRYIKLCMEVAGASRVESLTYTVRLQKGNPQVVARDFTRAELVELSAEHPFLIRVKPPVEAEYALDKVAIAKAAKAGEPIPAGVAVVPTLTLVIA